MPQDDVQRCEYNIRLEKYEHYFQRKADGRLVCSRCGEVREGGAAAFVDERAGQIRGERRTK